MCLQVSCVFILIVGSVLSSSPDLDLNAPNYVDFILGGYDFMKEDLKTQNTDAKDSSKRASKMESLLNLKRDIHQAYNLDYEIKDSEGRISYREEFGDGLGLIKGSITSPKNNGDKTVINYIINVEQIPAYENIIQRSFASDYEMPKGVSSQQMEPETTVYKAPTRVYSMSMDKDGKVTRQESFLPANSDFDSFQMRSSPLPINYKSYPEGIEWSKVQDVEDEENEKPLYVFHTKPAIKSFESSRDLDGNYKNVYPAQQGGYDSQMFALN